MKQLRVSSLLSVQVDLQWSPRWEDGWIRDFEVSSGFNYKELSDCLSGSAGALSVRMLSIWPWVRDDCSSVSPPMRKV